MTEPEERSPSGSPVYRHKAADRPVELVAARSAFADRVEEHLTKHIGPPPNVLHELVSDRIHLDVHMCPPAGRRDYFVLFTTGLSTRPMNVPPGVAAPRYAELLLALPGNWPGLADECRDPRDPGHPWKDENNYWPIRLLKSLARLPSEYDTWLGQGHTIDSGGENQSFAPGTKLCSAMIDWPIGLLEPKAAMLELEQDEALAFYMVRPLYAEERSLKLKLGADALMKKMDAAGIGPVIDPRRANTCAKRTWWKLL